MFKRRLLLFSSISVLCAGTGISLLLTSCNKDEGTLKFEKIEGAGKNCKVVGTSPNWTTINLNIPATVEIGGEQYTVTEIADKAFFEHMELTTVIFPNTLTKIGNFAFTGDTSINGELNIPDSVTSIGQYAFASTHCHKITVGNGVSKIETGTFEDDPLLSSFFCGPVSSFGDYSFFRCKAFWEMWCTGTVQYVGKSAFFDDQLWRVRLHGWAENGIVMEKAFEYEQKNGNVVCEKSEAFWKLMVKNGLSSGWWHSDHE